MYHIPKKGKEFKELIDKWIDKHKKSYDEVVATLLKAKKELEQKIYEKESKNDNSSKQEEKINSETKILERRSKMDNFLKDYTEEEHFFVLKALDKNPYYMDIDAVVENLQAEMWEFIKTDKKFENRHKKENDKKKEEILYWTKKKLDAVHPKFEEWLAKETDINLLSSLLLLVSLKLYNRDQAFARQEILKTKKYWKIWRKESKYDVSKLFQ